MTVRIEGQDRLLVYHPYPTDGIHWHSEPLPRDLTNSSLVFGATTIEGAMKTFTVGGGEQGKGGVICEEGKQPRPIHPGEVVHIPLATGGSVDVIGS